MCVCVCMMGIASRILCIIISVPNVHTDHTECGQL